MRIHYKDVFVYVRIYGIFEIAPKYMYETAIKMFEHIPDISNIAEILR